MRHQARVSLKHIAGDENKLADRLSRYKLKHINLPHKSKVKITRGFNIFGFQKLCFFIVNDHSFMKK